MNSDNNLQSEVSSDVGKKEQVLDPYTLGAGSGWDSDPENPRNWTPWQKWRCVLVVSLYTFIPPLGTAIVAPGLPAMAEKYAITDSTMLALTLVMFLLSYALAPLILAPISEMYGRTWVYHIANLFGIGFHLGCAFAPSVGSLLALRFLAGATGAAPIALGAGTIGDLFAEKDRAAAMALYTLGPLFGPVIGPVAGGFMAENIGIKWGFILLGILSGVASLVGLPLLRETYAPVLLRRKMHRQQCSDDVEEGSEKKTPELGEETDKLTYLWTNLTRPIILLTRSLICFMLSLYLAFMYGTVILMITTFPELFHDIYGFGIGVGGLVYLGNGIGFLLATGVGVKIGQSTYLAQAKKNGGVGTPEMRIPALVFGSLFLPVGLFWYGWSAQAQLHWMMPIIGTAIFSFGMMLTYLPIQLYLVDSFTYAASAVSAASVFRSLLGFAFPLFADRMFDAMGIGGGNSLLGGLAIVLGIPFPVWLYFNGARFRAKSKFTKD